MVAAAVLGAGALGAGASIWGANTAANAQTSASNAAIQAQLQMQQKQQGILQPFVNAGQGAIGSLTNFLNPNDPGGGILNALQKLVMPGADQSATLAQTPGYQFNLSQGLRGVNNSLAARGLGGSAAVGKGAADYASGLAGNTWQSVVSALLGLFGQQGGALQNLVNTGANAAAGVGQGAIQTGQGIGNNLVGIGNARAGAATATGNALGGLGSTAGTAALIQQLTGGGGGGGGSSGLYGGDTFNRWISDTSGGSPGGLPGQA